MRRLGYTLGFLALVLTLGVGSAVRAATCLVSEGPIRARVALPTGGEARVRDGALELPGRVITPCEGLPGPFPTAVAVVGGRLVVGFRAAGAYVLEGSTFSAIEGLPEDSIRVLATVGERLWIGTGASGLWHWTGGRDPERVTHRTLGRREISALGVDRAGTLHVGAGMYGTWTVAGSGSIRRTERGVYAACFRSRGGGLKPALPGRECDDGRADAASGLPSPHITALAAHRGRLVVGTFDKGLSERGLDGQFHPISGSPSFINALLVDGPTLWVATPKGLYRRDGDGPVRRSVARLASEHVNGLAMGDDGTLWAATGQGVAGLGPDGGVRLLDVSHGLPSRIVYSVAVTDDGALWAGTAGGVARFGPEGATRYTQSSGALTHDWVNALFADGDTVLAGTYDAGVVRLFPGGAGVVDAELQGLWVNPGGLSYLGQGRVAVATLGDGLVVSDREGVQTIGPLPSDDVTSALVFDGALWVGTRGGLWAESVGPDEPDEDEINCRR
jgi:ligand-binding sensor domain-containing protein